MDLTLGHVTAQVTSRAPLPAHAHTLIAAQSPKTNSKLEHFFLNIFIYEYLDALASVPYTTAHAHSSALKAHIM